MVRAPKIGLLPLYLELYDKRNPAMRDGFIPFLQEIRRGFEARGIEVVQEEICRLAPEFDKAMLLFEQEGVDAIVTLHLAYSPSGESIEALCQTDTPLLLLDTTMDAAFGHDVDYARISYNHGIHGVMDLAAVLRRRERSFQVVAGTMREPALLDRAAQIIHGAQMAQRFRQMKTLRVGSPFTGMHDFYVSDAAMKKTLGIDVHTIMPADLASTIDTVSQADVDTEIACDRDRYDVRAPADVHEYSVRIGLGVRKYLDTHGFGAWTANFLAFDSDDSSACSVPFLEACKSMARGLGYAGEGDTLTSSLLGAIAADGNDATFTEIFCPDWAGNTLFLSHMGEINPAVAAATPVLVERQFPYTPARNPAYLACSPKPGNAVFVNLSPGPDATYRLILHPVTMRPDAAREDDRHAACVRGWMDPRMPLGDFLEKYSRLGGGHHSLLVYGDVRVMLQAFAFYAGLECRMVEEEGA